MNGKWKIGLVSALTSALLMLGAWLILGVSGAEPRAEARGERDALRIELQGDINLIQTRLGRIEGDVIELRTNSAWIRAALLDGGYRVPASVERKIREEIKRGTEPNR